jgi:hypothetical protein
MAKRKRKASKVFPVQKKPPAATAESKPADPVEEWKDWPAAPSDRGEERKDWEPSPVAAPPPKPASPSKAAAKWQEIDVPLPVGISVLSSHARSRGTGAV